MSNNSQPAIMKSQSENWGTPYSLFEKCEQRYDKFDLDAAADSNWSMVSEYITKEQDALMESTQWNGQNIWINPPYDYKSISKFINRSIEESKLGKRITLLLPAKTDQEWFHKSIHEAYEIIFIKKRLSFRRKEDGKSQSSTFASIIVHFDKSKQNSRANIISDL